MNDIQFTRGSIAPIECVREAWAVIKDDYWILFAISILGAMLGGVTMYVLIGPMICGIFYAYLKKMDGQRPAIDDLWVGFRYFGPSLGVTIAIVVPIVVWVVIMFITIYLPIITVAITNGRVDQDAILGTFIAGFVLDIIVALLMVCLHSLLIFSFPLIVDKGMNSWSSMKLSARAVLANLGGIGGLIAVNFGLVLAGELAFCVGLYLVIPVITASNLVAYRKVFPRSTI